MSDIAGKLEAIEDRFRIDSKGYDAARWIIRQNRRITSEERKALVQEIPIKYKTLQGVFTELRKMNLYPPQKTSDIPKQPPTTEKAPDPSHHDPEDPRQPQPEYATKEDFEILKNSIDYLASVISGEPPSNPGEYTEEAEEDIEVIPPEEMFIQDPSVTSKSVWIKPKTWMYFDMARQGTFSNYAGTRDLGPFTQFDGNISDFFNILADDYFIRLYNADIGLLMRRYSK